MPEAKPAKQGQGVKTIIFNLTLIKKREIERLVVQTKFNTFLK